MNSVRLITWNILEGFLKPACKDTDGRMVDRPRLELARALIASFEPDILVFNEALRPDSAVGEAVNYVQAFGLPFEAHHLYDGPWGNTTLSKFPIRDTFDTLIHEKGSAQNRGALAVELEIAEKRLWVATLHPHPSRRPHKRAEDYVDLLETLKAREAREMILAGDFNAISPDDCTDKEALVSAFEKFSRPGQAEPSVYRMLKAGRHLFNEVMPKYDLRDLVADRTAHTIPTPLLGGCKSSAMRIDHVLGTPGIVVGNATAIHDALADMASDHYPVMVDFEIA